MSPYGGLEHTATRYSLWPVEAETPNVNASVSRSRRRHHLGGEVERDGELVAQGLEADHEQRRAARDRDAPP